MEGGSPAAIWERWTLPMLYAQRRFWSDNPPLRVYVRMLVARHYKLPKPRRTRAPSRAPAMDLSKLDAPLTPAELAALNRGGKPMH